jgi:hypothetical protein
MMAGTTHIWYAAIRFFVIFTRIDKCRLAVIHFGYVQYEVRQLADLNLVSTPKIVRLCPAVIAFGRPDDTLNEVVDVSEAPFLCSVTVDTRSFAATDQVKELGDNELWALSGAI